MVYFIFHKRFQSNYFFIAINQQFGSMMILLQFLQYFCLFACEERWHGDYYNTEGSQI